MKNIPDNPFKIVIIGRAAGTGKDAMKRTLMETIPGIRPLKTHTDRPKRFPQEDSYIFHTKQEAAAIPRQEKLLYTKLSDGERFTAKEDLEEANLMVLDPSGFHEACRQFPQEASLVLPGRRRRKRRGGTPSCATGTWKKAKRPGMPAGARKMPHSASLRTTKNARRK